MKFAVIALVTYQVSVSWLPSAIAGAVIGGIFILPYLFLSSIGGQLADGWDKARLMRRIKEFEVGIAVVVLIGFLVESVPLLLLSVLLLGMHSTVFGPVKYAYLPDHLAERELTGGNGLLEMGTFVAIVLGNVAGGLLSGIDQNKAFWIGGTGITVALIGRIAAQFVPPTPPKAIVPVTWRPIRDTWALVSAMRPQLGVWRSILGISWMWFVGSVLLGVFPSLAHDVLRGNTMVASGLLVLFAIGMAIGAMTCEKLSHHHVEIGLVPIGSFGITVGGIWMAWALQAAGLSAVQSGAALGSRTLMQVATDPSIWPVAGSLVTLAVFMGWFSVPMYAFLQWRALPGMGARTIAANNVINALFMIGSAAWTGIGLSLTHQSIAGLIALTAIANVLVAFYVFSVVPEYVLRFVSYVVSHLGYRLRVEGDSHIPTRGAAVLIANHVSFIDAVLLMSVSPRPIRFVMDAGIFRQPVLGSIFRLAGAIPVTPRAEDPEAYASAFKQVAAALDEGEPVAIFPEGMITKTGELGLFKPGVRKILDRNPVPVIPIGLSGMWGSYFSRAEKGKAMVRPFRRGAWSRVTVSVGSPLSSSMTIEEMRNAVDSLLEDNARPLGAGGIPLTS